jgi:hypothetical protein
MPLSLLRYGASGLSRAHSVAGQIAVPSTNPVPATSPIFGFPAYPKRLMDDTKYSYAFPTALDARNCDFVDLLLTDKLANPGPTFRQRNSTPTFLGTQRQVVSFRHTDSF